MDRIEGESLADRLGDGPLAPAEVRRLGRDVLDALAVIHRAGVVHRDIKPGNILLSGSRAMVTDFGIAREDSGLPSDLTVPGLVFGTPAYMAPEQAMGLAATTRSDLFAVGQTLYEAVTGRRFDPYDASAWAAVPAALAAPLRRALELEPDQRWPNAETFREALEERSPRTIAVAGGLLALAAAIVGGVMWQGRTPGGAAPLRPRVTVAPLTLAGAVSPTLGDSVHGALLRRLRGLSGFRGGDERRRPRRLSTGGCAPLGRIRTPPRDRPQGLRPDRHDLVSVGRIARRVGSPDRQHRRRPGVSLAEGGGVDPEVAPDDRNGPPVAGSGRGHQAAAIGPPEGLAGNTGVDPEVKERYPERLGDGPKKPMLPWGDGDPVIGNACSHDGFFVEDTRKVPWRRQVPVKRWPREGRMMKRLALTPTARHQRRVKRGI